MVARIRRQQDTPTVSMLNQPEQRRYIKRQDLNIAVLDEILEEVLPTFIGRVAIIKIDVEGFEPFVFLGAQKLLNIVHPPAIMTEVSLATKGGTEQYVKYMSKWYDIRQKNFDGPSINMSNLPTGENKLGNKLENLYLVAKY